jgi:hypothetical protein
MTTEQNPQNLAAKLRAAGHQEPILPPSQPPKIDEEADAYRRFLEAQTEYLQARHRVSPLYAILGDLLDRAWGPLVLILCVALTTLICVTCARAVEVPDRIIAAIAQVETGTTWHAIGDVRGKWTRGSIGEIGPWQISPAVLRDLGATHKANRAHRDPVLAESLTRAWLAHLYRSTGDWRQAVAAYHAGLAGRGRPHGREYSDRVFNLVLQ